MIKPFIIAALTADGYIAKNESHPAVWTSKADKKIFIERTKQAGVIIMGSRTFETIGRPLKDRKTIVYTKDKTYEGVETTQEDPEKLLEKLEKEGFEEVAICGGTSIYTLFMERGLVHKLYLTIEGIVFGKGMTLFNKELENKLSLVSSKQIGDNTVLLEYIVEK